MGSGRNFVWQNLSQGKLYTIFHAITFSAGTPRHNVGLMQQRGFGKAQEQLRQMRWKGSASWPASADRVQTHFQATPVPWQAAKPTWDQTFGQYVLTDLSSPAPSSEYHHWSFKRCTRGWGSCRFFCTWTKSGPWSPCRLYCLLLRPALSPRSPLWSVHGRSCNAI